ncbi:MAG: hypothetical protein ABIH66_03690 [bacterium]
MYNRCNEPPDSFKEFTASQLYCPTCRRATPVRDRLLLVLPDGEVKEFVCTICGASVGKRRERGNRQIGLYI